MFEHWENIAVGFWENRDLNWMKKDPLFKFVPYDSRVITLLAHDLSRRVGHPIKNVFING